MVVIAWPRVPGSAAASVHPLASLRVGGAAPALPPPPGGARRLAVYLALVRPPLGTAGGGLFGLGWRAILVERHEFVEAIIQDAARHVGEELLARGSAWAAPARCGGHGVASSFTPDHTASLRPGRCAPKSRACVVAAPRAASVCRVARVARRPAQERRTPGSKHRRPRRVTLALDPDSRSGRTTPLARPRRRRRSGADGGP